MNNRILWIDDDYYTIKGLYRPLERKGFIVDVAKNALDGYRKGPGWENYDLIVVDLIIPLSDDEMPLPEEVASWGHEKYIGLGLVNWLITKIAVKCPILLLSVVSDPILNLQFMKYERLYYLPKSGLVPSLVLEKVEKLLEGGEIDNGNNK